MATARTATLVAAEAVAPATRVLELALPAGEPLAFKGGQYLIVNSGIVLPTGKLAKRAYSIVSPDDQQERVRLAVHHLPGGPGSSWLHALPVGAEVPFSGPWGQFVAPEDGADAAPALVVATDTGITAALGLLRSRAFAPRRARTRLVWATRAPHVPHTWLDELGVEVEIVGDADALPGRWRSAPAEDAWLCGDGVRVRALREALVAAGLAEARVRVETFFHHLVRKAA